MPTQITSLQLFEGNDETLKLTVTNESDGSATDLTGKDLEVVIKKSASADDTQGATYSTTGGAITITNAGGGQATCQTDAADLTPDKKWLRVDVIDSAGLRKTSAYGQISVVNT